MRRLLLAGVALALGALIGLPLADAGTGRSGARTDAKAKLERKLVGSWRLRSFVVSSADGRSYPFGQDAIGKLTYTADGNVWTVVARRGVPKNLPDALWYTGTFRIDLERKTLVHHIQHSSLPSWEGGDQLRPFKLRRDRLTLSAPPADPGGPTGVLRWERD